MKRVYFFCCRNRFSGFAAGKAETEKCRRKWQSMQLDEKTTHELQLPLKKAQESMRKWRFKLNRLVR
jgi:hypothetical protein